jgi:starch synthase
LADGRLFHQALAGSDLMLIPSGKEIGSVTQMQAHRYGTLPIVRREGSVADTVVDCDSQLITGNGFMFDEPSSEEMLATIRRGFAAFQNTDAWNELRSRVMRIDHSWDRSARQYERLYNDKTEDAAA